MTEAVLGFSTGSSTLSMSTTNDHASYYSDSTTLHPQMQSPHAIDEPTQISKACGKPQAPHTNVDPMVVSEQHGKAL